ncbi:MAG TPA: hypothetical protein ACFYEF_02975 [Candidatus Wunengus sp. YC63]|uniref:hypothetical protein n=1 Tax=unclassified Candidatus Wunengus TaxID=3367695 RepID=UPI00402605F7
MGWASRPALASAPAAAHSAGKEAINLGALSAAEKAPALRQGDRLAGVRCLTRDQLWDRIPLM